MQSCCMKELTCDESFTLKCYNMVKPTVTENDLKVVS